MQLDPSLVDAQRLRIRTVGDGGTVVDHREDSFGGGKPLLKARSEEHTSELQSLMRNSYAVFCLIKKPKQSDISSHRAYHMHDKILLSNSRHSCADNVATNT